MKSILKKISFLTILASINFLSFGQAIKVDCYGKVGIGVPSTPSCQLDVIYSGNHVKFSNINSYYGTTGIKIATYCAMSYLDPLSNYAGSLGFYNNWGTLYVNQIYSPNEISHGSDERLKENIKGLDSSLQTVLKLRGVRYDLKPEMYKGLDDTTTLLPYGISADDLKNHIGMIAQEVEKIVPEVVTYDSTRKMYGVRYAELIPYLIEAIKSQQNIIDAQSKEIKEITSRLGVLEDNSNLGGLKSVNMATNITSAQTTSITNAFLYQNEPNPFSNITKLGYFLPEGIQNASLLVLDMQGTLLKTYSINSTGNGSITINSYQFKPGMYFYTLIADEQIVDTKRMILTD